MGGFVEDAIVGGVGFLAGLLIGYWRMATHLAKKYGFRWPEKR